METTIHQIVSTRDARGPIEPLPMPYGEWEILGDASAVHFTARSFGLLSVRGTLGRAGGVLISAPDAEPSAAGAIELEGLATGIEKRDRHLLGPDYLDAEAHPWIGFSAERIDVAGRQVRARARLTIRGVSREVEIAGTLTRADGPAQLELRLEGRLDRRDFGVRSSGPREWGGLAVGRTVRLDACLGLRRSEARP